MFRTRWKQGFTEVRPGVMHVLIRILICFLVDLPTLTGKDEDAILAPLYQVELNSGVIINPLIIPKSQWGTHITPFYINVENERVLLFSC